MKNYIKNRIIDLKKSEIEFFDKQYEYPKGHPFRSTYRQFSNECHARRDELERIEELLSVETVKLREVCLKHSNGRCSKLPSPENCNSCDEYE